MQENLTENGEKKLVAKRTFRPASTPKKKNNPQKKKQPVLNEETKTTVKKTEQKTNSKKGKVNAKNNKKQSPVRIYFLGGVGEIGKNMTAFECNNEIIIVDVGLIFPDEQMHGIDLVIPDASFLMKNKKKIKGVILTHGHEDHIGGIPYIIKDLGMPTLYGTKLTLALVDNKLRENRINNAKMKTVKPGERLKLGTFDVELVNVNHSIPGSLGLAIRTPQGLIYHSGDFKIDMTPVEGDPIDLTRLAQLGNEGVLLLMAESTNVERQGYTMSETVVRTTFEHLFNENTDRRIIVATFASNVHRIQQIFDIAKAHKRKVALSGRSMLNVVEASQKIGEITIPEDTLIDIDKIKNYFDKELVIISTGSQGEAMSALTRMASGDFNKVVIGDNDTVIISANPIPGNEKMIYRVINNLYRKGAKVVYESLEKIHVSGHACGEELKILHSLLKPKYFVPIHGEYRHLKRHCELAHSLGMRESNTLIAEIGNTFELTSKSLKRVENIEAGSKLVDGSNIEDGEDSVVLRDRKQLAEDGVCVCVVGVSLDSSSILGDIEIVTKGIVWNEEKNYIADMKGIIEREVQAKMYNSPDDINDLSRRIRKQLKNYLYKKTRQAPMIVPIVLDT